MATKQSGLGRGLGDLFARTDDETPAPLGDGSRFAELPVDAITPNPQQPRTVFDEDDLGEASDARLGYEQDGPDLFGMEPDELILPTEPTPVDDPEMDIDLDQMDEIPIDPDDEPEAELVPPSLVAAE